MAVDSIKNATLYEAHKTEMKQGASTNSNEVQKAVPEQKKTNDLITSNEVTLDNDQSTRSKSDDKLLKSAVDHANSKFKQNRTRCEFTYHEQTKQVSIKIIDDDTKEVIREIPSEESIRMVEKMWELAGILVDERR